VAWTFQAKGIFNSSPVASEGIVFAASNDGTVHAIVLDTGAETWSTTLSADVEGTPLLAGNTLVVGDLDGIVHGLATDTGTERWTARTTDAIHGAAVGDEHEAYVTSGDGTAYAIDPGDMRTAMHQAAFPGEDISDRPLPETVVPAIRSLLRQRPANGRYRAADFAPDAAGTADDAGNAATAGDAPGPESAASTSPAHQEVSA
jgi:hypothetical protein